MSMSYSQMMDKEDRAQEIDLEIESTLLELEKTLSSLGYVVDEDSRSLLNDAVDLLVNDKYTVRGFREMTLAQYDQAYQDAI
ncbi:hypothetical protein RHO13_00660 [Orbus wheelerorum]|uniref:hypothetical protein n=1 Tax=Orbus wheelerorum TaxID=3074111 RepID=UPI00370D7783